MAVLRLYPLKNYQVKNNSACIRFANHFALLMHCMATEVNKLRDRVQRLEGSGMASEPLSVSLQRIMEDLDYQF